MTLRGERPPAARECFYGRRNGAEMKWIPDIARQRSRLGRFVYACTFEGRREAVDGEAGNGDGV